MTDETNLPEGRSEREGAEVVVQVRDAVALARLREPLDDGGVALPGPLTVDVGRDYTILLIHPDGRRRLRLKGTVMRLTEGSAGGATLLLAEFDDDLKARIVTFATAVAKEERTLFERISKMPATEQRKLAKSRSIEERVIVERLMGKIVWENLLRNPNLTPPEVARIAQRHDLPIPLLNLIVEGEKWLRLPEIRRSLLNNPRLGGGAIFKVLRHLNKMELQRLAKERATPMAVRIEVQKLLKRHQGGPGRP